MKLRDYIGEKTDKRFLEDGGGFNPFQHLLLEAEFDAAAKERPRGSPTFR